MRKIRVLLLLHELTPSGAPKVALRAFQRFGDAVQLRTLATLGGPLEAEFRALGPVQVLVRQGWPGAGAPPGMLARFAGHWALSRAKAWAWAGPLRRWRPDVVYINSVVGLLIVRRFALPPAPVLLHVHELDSVLADFAVRYPSLLLHLPTRYIAVSEAVREALTERFGVAAEKVVVVPAFADDVPLSDVPTDRTEDRTEGPLVVGGGGDVSWYKGPQLWLMMAAELKQRLGAGRVRFVWVGVSGGEDDWRFREMARKLGLAGDVEIVMWTPRPLAEFARFDVFALTSWQETASLVMMENMLLERPVVCFRGSGGPWEFVGGAGVVLDGFSPARMADAIAALAGDPERRRALGRAARARVRANFTAEIQAPRILAEIQKLASGADSM